MKLEPVGPFGLPPVAPSPPSPPLVRPSPVKAEDCNGTAFDVELVPMAHTHLRLTVLPVLENAIGA